MRNERATLTLASVALQKCPTISNHAKRHITTNSLRILGALTDRSETPRCEIAMIGQTTAASPNSYETR